MKILCAAAALLAASAMIAPTVAQAEDSASISVGYGDLNLRSAAAQRTLEGRIGSAVRNLCASVQAADLSSRQASSQCSKQALKSAWPAYQAAVRAANGTATVVAGATLTIAAQ